MKVVIATGGTGGHLFPALWVAEKIQRKENDVLLVGSFTVGQEQITKKGFTFIDLKAKGMRFKGLKDTFFSLWLMFIAFFKALLALFTYKPQVVLGFGGYGSFPVVLAGRLLGVPTIIHEQNVVPGRANAFLGKITDKVAVSFQETQAYFDKRKVVVTGCPCHQIRKDSDQKTVLEFFGFKEKKFTFLVFGGSQGSERINEVFVNSLESLRNIKDFQVIHITGTKKFDKIKETYLSAGIKVALFSFLGRMDYAYSLADMVISRSGAVTVAEIIQAQVPSILIPYPYAYAGHQKMNAEILSNKKLAMLIEEKDLNEESLESAILTIFDKMQSLKNLNELFLDISYTDSSERLAAETLKLGKKNQ